MSIKTIKNLLKTANDAKKGTVTAQEAYEKKREKVLDGAVRREIKNRIDYLNTMTLRVMEKKSYIEFKVTFSKRMFTRFRFYTSFNGDVKFSNVDSHHWGAYSSFYGASRESVAAKFMNDYFASLEEYKGKVNRVVFDTKYVSSEVFTVKSIITCINVDFRVCDAGIIKSALDKMIGGKNLRIKLPGDVDLPADLFKHPKLNDAENVSFFTRKGDHTRFHELWRNNFHGLKVQSISLDILKHVLNDASINETLKSLDDKSLIYRLASMRCTRYEKTENDEVIKGLKLKQIDELSQQLMDWKASCLPTDFVFRWSRVWERFAGDAKAKKEMDKVYEMEHDGNEGYIRMTRDRVYFISKRYLNKYYPAKNTASAA